MVRESVAMQRYLLLFRAVFWVILPCKMIVDDKMTIIPDDGGSTHL
jgi:hypothetical protein